MAIQIVNYVSGINLVTPTYLDANFLISCLFRPHMKYRASIVLLLELFRQKRQVFISTLTLDEVWWGLLSEWYRADTGDRITRWIIKANPSLLSNYSRDFVQVTSSILRWKNLVLLPDDKIDPENTTQLALEYLAQHRIPPRDVFHLALVRLSGARGFITADDDFDHLQIPGVNLTIYKY